MSVTPAPAATPRKVSLSGFNLINSPRLNKGTAFTDHERDIFSLHGLLPPHIGTLQEQVHRRTLALDDQATSFNKYSFLRDLQDLNETLFYALLLSDLEKMLPLVYTPTVGEACQRFSEVFRKPRGLYLSYPNQHRIEQILSHPRYDDIRCIVVSDGERILGLGDQGAGGMGIPIGKMALYTALGGIHPEHCLPIFLDVGTDNQDRLDSPIYIGWCHRRIRGAEYDAFIDTFVQAVKKRWPHVLLQWEDFAGANAARLLARYRNQLCTFNDDIQGTAAIAAATLVSAIRRAGSSLPNQTIAIFGFGSAGLGIASLLAQFMQDAGLSAEEARARIYPIDIDGLIVDDRPNLDPAQQPFAHPAQQIQSWRHSGDAITLHDVVRNAHPTVLIGVSGQPGAFTQEIIRDMAAHTDRPIIFPLSNPTSRSEATPHDLIHWTEGRALIGTGSPFPPVHYAGKTFRIAQTNNAFIFPGLALGIIASRARYVTDSMIKAAATELIRHLPTRHDPNACMLPPISQARELSRYIATAVGKQAINEGLAQIPDEPTLLAEIEANFWLPAYEPYERA
ncbi:MAG: NAD-dependent malic enzyme [Acidobacteriaceae bacterium]